MARRNSRPAGPRLLDQHVLVCVGAGGVGKTTVAASLGVAAARQHRRAAVITFDPARRLKDALGLSRLGIEPRPVELDPPRTRMDAMAIDTKRIFDSVVQRFAPSREVAAQILANRLYQQLSDGLAGSAEYMAMEKLHELAHAGRYECLVVDTPPSANARELPAAPARLGELLATRAVALLKNPGDLLGRDGGVARAAMATLLKALERWTGLTLLSELAAFVAAFESLLHGFQSRAEEVARLLRADSTRFVVVTTPEPDAIAGTIALHRDLRDLGFHIAGIVANRALAFPRLDPTLAANGPMPPRLRRKLLANYADFERLAQRDRRTLKYLHHETGLPLLAAIPLQSEPPSSLAALDHFATYLGHS